MKYLQDEKVYSNKFKLVICVKYCSKLIERVKKVSRKRYFHAQCCLEFILSETSGTVAKIS